MSVRDWLVIASLVGTLGVIVYGGIKLGWGLNQNSVAFIWLGIMAGICAGFGPSKIAKCFVNGAKEWLELPL